ncbi:mobile element protein [Geminocystis sp. NIES-3709]|nr:mobile element protein [Geminocystis sp. NIES-3709]
MDCKATVNIGDYSRGGKTRGNNQAQDHDMGEKEKYIPCGIVDEDSGQLYLNFGSSHKTSDFIVDNISMWWENISTREKEEINLIQIKIDNGSESSGVRTQFLKRMVEFASKIQKRFSYYIFLPIIANKYLGKINCIF